MLRVDNIYVNISKIPVLRGVNLYVGKGELVALLGRNGAGKTTTLRSIMGILKPSRGKVIFMGKDITRLSPHKIAKLGVGYAPEDRKIFTDLTVEENIEIAIRDLRRKSEILKNIYEVFPKLREIANRKGGYLSGGEQKMLAIARALALEPKLLLLDEPFEGLAPVFARRLYNAVREIKKRGLSILMAESNLMHVLSLSDIIDRIYVIERGEIIFKGSPSEVLENKEVLKILRGY